MSDRSGSGASRGFFRYELERRASVGERFQFGEKVRSRQAREDASIQLDRKLRRNDVRGGASSDAGRRSGIAEDGCERFARRSEQPQERLAGPRAEQPADRELLVPGKLPGHRLEHESSHRRDVHGESARRDPREKPPELLARCTSDDARRVPSGASHRRADQATLFLRDLDRNEPPAALPQRVAAELTQGVAYAAEQVCVLFDKELHAGVAARFFVAREREDDVAGGRGLRRRRPHQRRKQHRHAALHVKGASPPDLAVDQIATERRMSPLARVRRNNVDMAVEEKRWRLAPTLDTSNEIGSLVLDRQVPVLDFGALE